MFIVFPNVPGAMFIQGGTFIQDSRVSKEILQFWGVKSLVYNQEGF